ncbi:MAG: carboxypeptidase-like regulatory domain-containing protein [Candidatus Marinimicrobia bacterium]|nr:carboxypeptidase-like regulatory domain-containing protein [Candidatus Neomarinimicrobiota bacterium]
MKFTHIVLCAMILINFECDLVEKVDEAIIDVSGKVTDEGQVVEGAIVLLIESADVSEGLGLANGSITDSNGRYVILNVDAGDYYVLAVEDRNDNFEFDADADRLGFYGVNPGTLDITPDRITVSDLDIEDIDIVDLYSL